MLKYLSKRKIRHILGALFVASFLFMYTGCGGSDEAAGIVGTNIPSAADTSRYGLTYD